MREEIWGPPPVDHHRANADVLEKDQVLGKGEALLSPTVEGPPSELDDEGLSVERPNVGKGVDEDLGLFVNALHGVSGWLGCGGGSLVPDLRQLPGDLRQPRVKVSLG